MTQRAQYGINLSYILVMGALFVFIICPLAAIFTQSLWSEQGFDPMQCWEVIARSENFHTIVNSLELGLLVVIVTTVIATPLAFILARTHWARCRWIDIVLLLPFMTPPYIAAMGWILFMQKRGLLEQMVPAAGHVTPAFFSLSGLVLIMSLHTAPFMVTMIKNAILNIGGNQEEAASVSGAGFILRMRRVLLPLLTGNYAIAMLLVFVKTLAEYGTPSTLGRRINFEVFTTQIHDYATTAPIDFGSAASLSLVLIVICMFMWIVQNWTTNRFSFDLIGKKGKRKIFYRPTGPIRTLCGLIIAAYVFLAVTVPWFSVIATSLIKLRGYGLAWGNFTFDHYVELFTEDANGFAALATSLFLAFSCALIASLVGTFIVSLIRKISRVWGRRLEGLSLVPEMLPSIVMAIGLMLLWNRLQPYIPIYNTLGFMVLTYCILYLPFSVQYVNSAWMQMGTGLQEAARVSGGSSLYIFRRVTLPLIAAGVVQGFIMIFIIVFRELVAASLISPPDVLVVSTFIVQEFEQGSASVAMAMALICVVVSAVLLYILRGLVLPRLTRMQS